MNTDEQKALVVELKNGNEDAFNKFVLFFGDKIRGMAYNMTQDPEAAEDITQNVFINVYRKISLFRNESKLSSWVYRIAINEIFMYYRKAKKNKHTEYQDHYWFSSNWSNPEAASLSSEFNKLLRRSVGKLGDKEMKVFVHRDIDEMSTNEACETLKATVPAVKSRLLRGRRKLRKSDVGKYIMIETASSNSSVRTGGKYKKIIH